MSRRHPTPVDAAIAEARDRMDGMMPGDMIIVPIIGGRWSTHVFAQRIRNEVCMRWGKGKYSVIRHDIVGQIAVTRLP